MGVGIHKNNTDGPATEQLMRKSKRKGRQKKKLERITSVATEGRAGGVLTNYQTGNV